MKVWVLRISYKSFIVTQVVRNYAPFYSGIKMQINLFRVLLLELQRCLQSMICFCFQNISSINFNRFGSKNIMSYTTEKKLNLAKLPIHSFCLYYFRSRKSTKSGILTSLFHMVHICQCRLIVFWSLNGVATSYSKLYE